MSLEGFESWRPFRRGALGTDSLTAPDSGDAHLAPVHSRPISGQQVGRFRLLTELHRGRNSSIFEAFDKPSGRPVAIKVLAPELAIHQGPRDRFDSEAQLANRVAHPAILPILHRDVGDGYLFAILRLENGDTLHDLATDARGRKDEEYFIELARRFASVAEAVGLLHEGGIVHRDIEPTNILVDGEGQFLLTDFGSALDRETDETGLDQWIGGTLRYMSPEQILPGADPFDPAGDVYSLGLTLYELLVGTPAFPDCEHEALARLKLTRRPPNPRRVNASVPMGLDAIVRQAIESNRALRYANARELARDLLRFVAHRRGSHRRHHAEDRG